MITVKTKLKEILKYPVFKNKKYMISPTDGIMGRFFTSFSFEGLQKKVPTWNADSMAAGMEYLFNAAKKGQVFYDIWSDHEKQVNPSKENTGAARMQSTPIL